MKKRSKRGMPHIYVIAFALLCLALLLTWIIPGGSFVREEGRVVSESFHAVPSRPQSPLALFPAILGACVKQGPLIFMIFFVGAAIKILEQGQALSLAFVQLSQRMRGREPLLIFGVMALLSVGGAAGVFGNAAIALVPLGIYLSKAMGMDRGLGFLMVFLGCFSGFNLGWANMGILGQAQDMAGLPLYSGNKVRMAFHGLNFFLCFAFVIRYYKRVKADPRQSLNAKEGQAASELLGFDKAALPEAKLTGRQKLVLGLAGASVLFSLYGGMVWHWSNAEIASFYLGVALSLGLLSGFGANGTAEAFVAGCQAMVKPALIVGLTSAFAVLLREAQVLDSIVHAFFRPLEGQGPLQGALLLVLVNALINFFMVSGSGQGATVMPLMLPLAERMGLTAQVTVQAFQFGDGLTNVLWPTVGTLMSALDLAGIAYRRYLRLIFPLFLLQTGLSLLAIAILQALQWTGL